MDGARPFRPDLFTGWQEGEEAFLIGSRCADCGRASFPPRPVCAGCPGGGKSVEARLGPVGALYAMTVVHVAGKRFHPPYAIGFVDLPEGVRVCAQLTGFPVEGPHPPSGTEMEMVVETMAWDAGGHPILGYKFRPRRQVGRGPGAES